MKKLLFVFLTLIFSSLGMTSAANYFSKSHNLRASLDNSDKSGDGGNHRG